MPDIPLGPDPWWEDWPAQDGAVIRVPAGQFSVRRFKGPIPEPREPLKGGCAERRCRHHAYERRLTDGGDPDDPEDWVNLCPRHAEAWDAAGPPDTTAPRDETPADEAARMADQRRRRDMGVAGYQRNRPDRPSKTPEGRQEEYRKARLAKAAAAGDVPGES